MTQSSGRSRQSNHPPRDYSHKKRPRRKSGKLKKKNQVFNSSLTFARTDICHCSPRRKAPAVPNLPFHWLRIHPLNSSQSIHPITLKQHAEWRSSLSNPKKKYRAKKKGEKEKETRRACQTAAAPERPEHGVPCQRCYLPSPAPTTSARKMRRRPLCVSWNSKRWRKEREIVDGWIEDECSPPSASLKVAIQPSEVSLLFSPPPLLCERVRRYSSGLVAHLRSMSDRAAHHLL